MIHSLKTIAPAFKNNKTFRKKILGIDCDPAVIAAGRNLLQSRGFDVVTATTLKGALAACAVNHFEAVVVGRNVPEALTQAFRTRHMDAGGPPVFCLSAQIPDYDPKIRSQLDCDLQTQDLRRALGL
jgi:DNA-binding response OmpR family regulator